MRKDTRERLLIPVLLPLGIFALIGGVLFGFSRILPSVEPHAATATALVVAFSIVVFAAFAAGRSQVRFSTVTAMAGAVAGVAMLAGGVALLAFAPAEEHPGGGPGGGGGGPVATVQLVARNIQFVQTKLVVPSGSAFHISFQNDDAGTQHNVQIFDNKQRTGTPLFSGPLVTGVATATYDVSALDAGTYYFHCEVHPTMIGTIQAKPEAGGASGASGATGASGGATGASGAAGGGGAPGTSLTVTAQNIQFDTSEIDLTAGAPSTITFKNEDPGTPHNIAIYTDQSLSTNLFKGDVITGPATANYDVPALDPGTYYFHCDVHPTMSGSVVVK
ncbi:MAG TPA: cupredoxin domain-containing protein [Actinomycetota bacterium]|nr:cupredoxin domain-containing protein [Actinomycetota bacterium]